MDATRFDTIAKLLAERRLSRRQALAQGGAGLAVGALAVAGLSTPALAQDAEQDAAEDTEQDAKQGPTMLFLQAFQSGSVVPKDGAEGRFTVTLEQGLGHTVYFSDRPDRIVGATPTPQFLHGLGFRPENPPNAALVVETESGETDITVVALYDPAYDLETRTATYEVEVLAEWQRSLEVGFTEATTDLAQRLPAFSSAHLFIDDCPEGPIVCYVTNASGITNFTGTFQNAEHGGYAYSGAEATCLPGTPWNPTIADAVAYWKGQCNATFADCNGQCQVLGVWGQ